MHAQSFNFGVTIQGTSFRLHVKAEVTCTELFTWKEHTSTFLSFVLGSYAWNVGNDEKTIAIFRKFKGLP